MGGKLDWDQKTLQLTRWREIKQPEGTVSVSLLARFFAPEEANFPQIAFSICVARAGKPVKASGLKAGEAYGLHLGVATRESEDGEWLDRGFPVELVSVAIGLLEEAARSLRALRDQG